MYTRQLSHELQVEGEKNAVLLAASAKLLYVYRRNPSLLARSDADRHVGYPTNRELIEFIDENEELRDAASEATRLAIKGYQPSLMGCLIVVFSEAADWGTSVSFFEDLSTGEDLSGNSPVYLLREAVLGQRPHRKIQRRMMAALTIKAWNYWTQGETLRFLRWRAVGPSKEKFPEVSAL